MTLITFYTGIFLHEPFHPRHKWEGEKRKGKKEEQEEERR